MTNETTEQSSVAESVQGLDAQDLLDYADRELNLGDQEAQEIYAALKRLQAIESAELPEPRRFTVCNDAMMDERSDGQYVDYSDWAKVADRLAAAEADIAVLHGCLNGEANSRVSAEEYLAVVSRKASVTMDELGEMRIERDRHMGAVKAYMDDATQMRIERDLAESRLKALVEGMRDIRDGHIPNIQQFTNEIEEAAPDANEYIAELAEFVSATLLREVEGR